MSARVLLALLLASCTDPERTRATLDAAGFTRITITGHDAWSCGDDDTYCTGFEATAPSGRRVRGAVGCGIGKGCTVRITR